MGESVFEGTLTKWLKKVGDAVARDEPLFEISTDKVDSEIPSPASGILSEILIPEGKTIQINTVLAIINEAGIEQKETVIPASEVTIAPRQVPEDLPKAKPVSPPAPQPTVRPEPIQDAAAGTSPSIRLQDIRTSPLVRRLAREHNVDLSTIRGTGLEGRITKEDVLSYLKQPSIAEPSVEPQRAEIQESMPVVSTAAPDSEPAGIPAPSVPDFSAFTGEAETIPMTPMRKAIAEHMVRSKRTSAHVSTVFEVDMGPIVRLRESQKAEFEKREGIPLTYTPFFVKALVDTIREYPVFNSSVLGDSIVYKKPINVGIAVALDTGLIVPVIKDAHLKSFTGLALAIHHLAERARSKKLKPEDVQNGTVSITNPGIFGALFGTPIISQPQVAILGVGGIEKRPVVVNDAIAIRSMVYLSLTYDHRVIDGAVADQFMARLKERLQSWTQWVD